jgi:hypothetical protein
MTSTGMQLSDVRVRGMQLNSAPVDVAAADV